MWYFQNLQRRNWVGGAGARVPPAFRTLAKDMSLAVTHFTLGLRPCIISHPSYYKYTCAPRSKLLSCAPPGSDGAIMKVPDPLLAQI